MQMRSVARICASALLALGALLIAACATAPEASPSASIGAFEAHADIGAVSHAGDALFDESAGRYSVTGGGANIWGERDAFHYVWTRRAGDLHIAADIDWVGAGHDPHRKAGLMIRQSLDADSPYIDVMVHGDGLTSMQWRDVAGGATHEILFPASAPPRVRLEREGQYVFVSIAGPDGVLRHAGGNYRIAFAEPYYAGLAVSAHDDARTETAHFSNLELNVPVLAHVLDTGYPAAVESTVEIIDIASGNRRVIYQLDGKLEAPNWSPDGAFLIFNQQGLLYRLPLDGGAPTPISTGSRIRNNNDHGISPDGRLIVISDQSEADNRSRIYVAPIEGSDSPRLVMGHPDGPSYWHAWSPDGATLYYVAHRPRVVDDYDIYAVDLAGGPERRITEAMGLDDGPDFSPDGAWLYFNSARTGHMQIWRARPDGSNPEQVTSDENFRDWFPHPSPDGSWIVFISFGLDVALADHPPNRDVALRIMPADGSAAPRELTRLFGGQGTINVPSWSPDSTRVAFVSYRLKR